MGSRPSESSVQQTEQHKLPTAEELERIQQDAYDEGFASGKKAGFEQGRAEGLATAKGEARQLVEQMESIIQTLEAPLRELDDQVEQELLELVIATVRQLVRREVKSDPYHIIGVVREAMSILPVSSRNVRLMLHPDDAVLIREAYSLGDAEVGWKLVEDPVLARGGCKVLTETSQVDATLESRLAALIAPLLAGARTLDEESSSGSE